MADTEQTWDERLQINTAGRDDILSDEYRYPYEPTPYCVLERLAESGLLSGEDTVLDYGCGKGRVGFFLAKQTGAKCLGVDYDQRMLAFALHNKENAAFGDGVDFLLTCAETFELPSDIDRCYFFNPFSVQILRGVMAKILRSYYESPREMLLLFYYPSDEYVGYLMTVEELWFEDEIDCRDLFGKDDERERILIFRLPGHTSTCG